MGLKTREQGAPADFHTSQSAVSAAAGIDDKASSGALRSMKSVAILLWHRHIADDHVRHEAVLESLQSGSRCRTHADARAGIFEQRAARDPASASSSTTMTMMSLSRAARSGVLTRPARHARDSVHPAGGPP